MPNKILITGAAGFLGSHLVDYFLNKNYLVYGIDNFITGSLSNIKKNLNNNSFHFIEQDICETFNFNYKIDYILHFASPASPIDYLKIPLITLKTGSTGTENILNIAKDQSATFLLASTSEVYGDPLVHPQNENYYGNVNPIGPRGVYDEAKRYGEALTMAYHKKYGIDTKIARIFNTYGPRMRLNDGRALPTFIKQLINNKDLTIFGDGSQTRSFCYYEDTLDGIFKLLKSNYNYPVNIGNDQEVSLIDFAKEIIKIGGGLNSFTFKSLPENDPLRRKPCIKLAKEKIRWSPKIDRHEGLKKTIAYYLKENN